MIRRPPRSTRTDTLFPYTTLFRSNALVAAGLVIATGGDPARTLGNLARLQPVRGRLERAAITRAGAPVYIDYAHTPDAIAAALDALRPHSGGRLILVFGAGERKSTRLNSSH